MRIPNSRLKKIGYAAGGLIAGGILATAFGAQAATPSPTTNVSTSSTTADPPPGDKGADGVPARSLGMSSFNRNLRAPRREAQSPRAGRIVSSGSVLRAELQ